MSEHKSGPDHDKELFSEISEVFRRHPAMKDKYCVSCVDHETEILKISFSKEVGLRQIVGKTVVTEFVPPDAVNKETCCMWGGD